jgi:hypothetical protein
MKNCKSKILAAVIWFLFSVLILSLSSPVIAKEESTGEQRKSRLRFLRKPTMSIYYGFTNNSLKDLNRSLANPRLLEIKLGGTYEELKNRSAKVIKYEYNYFSLANISNDLGNQAESDEIGTDLWRIALGGDRGYGYRLGHSKKSPAIILCHSGGIHWSRLDVKDGVANPSDSVLLDLFDGAFRFGTMMEANVKFKISSLLVFDAGFERAILFRRHLFWKWLGSMAIEGTIQLLIDEFVERIMESSPQAAPLVNFILKNGATYGIYELRKDKMNYPFKSGSPLVNDSFKFGWTFVF